MSHIDDINDETPLLQANDMSRKPTLLPTSQILVICSERLCDVITLSSISPYINQVREMLLDMQHTPVTSLSANQRASNYWW